MWDRFDMCIRTEEIGYEQLRSDSNKDNNTSDSESMKKAVMRAREKQLKRFEDMDIKYNSQMNAKDIKRFCKLGAEAESLMKRIFTVRLFPQQT